MSKTNKQKMCETVVSAMEKDKVRKEARNCWVGKLLFQTRWLGQPH